ncbi:MAG: hypothetical protein FJ149_05290 [Euryarchaeota archaeon]|nr:hypothetical protein [Euryarchaeota archaeon]
MNDVQHRKRKTRDLQDIDQKYLSGLSTNQIAQIFGVNGITIRRDLAKTKTSMRAVGFPRKHHFNTGCFHSIDNEEAAYWLGFLYADGSVNWIARTVSLIIKDKDHLDKFQRFLGSDYDIKFNVQRNIYALTVSSIDMIKDLMYHGCVPGKTKRLSFPDIPDQCNQHFIRGFFDGDGSWSINLDKKFFSFAIGSMSLPLLLRIQDLLIVHCELNRHKIYAIMDFHNLKYGGTQIIRIGQYLYKNANVLLDRKYAAFNKFEQWYNAKYGRQIR